MKFPKRCVIFCDFFPLLLLHILPGADQAVSRLLKNLDDIRNAIKPYHGEQAGNQLASMTTLPLRQM
jgi:hypothetical protein